MSIPLLAAKLRVPTVSPNLVPRPRLTAQLADGLTRPLTLVSAPAGFGKTTLLSEWRETAEGRQYPLAWLSLDEDDNDSARFLTYLAAALDNFDAGSSRTVEALLQSSPRPSVKSVVAALIGALAVGRFAGDARHWASTVGTASGSWMHPGPGQGRRAPLTLAPEERRSSCS